MHLGQDVLSAIYCLKKLGVNIKKTGPEIIFLMARWFFKCKKNTILDFEIQARLRDS